MLRRLSEVSQIFWRQPQIATGFLTSFSPDQRPRVAQLARVQLVDQLVNQFFPEFNHQEASSLVRTGTQVRLDLLGCQVIGHARLVPIAGTLTEVYKKNEYAFVLGINVSPSIAKIPVLRRNKDGRDKLLGNILVHELIEGVEPIKDVSFDNLSAFASVYDKVMETLALNLNRGVVFRDLTLEDIYFGHKGIFFPRLKGKDLLSGREVTKDFENRAPQAAIRTAAALSGEFAAEFYTRFGMESFYKVDQVIKNGANSFRLRLDPRWGYSHLADPSEDQAAWVRFHTTFGLRYMEVFEWLQRVGKVRAISPN